VRRYFGWALASIISVGFAGLGGAMAADMAVKARPAPVAVAVWNWTGFYLGANVGGAWTDHESFTGADPFNTFGLAGGPFVPATTTGSGSGVVGGIHGGYNWQLAPQFLLGIEADISGADVKFSTRQQPLVRACLQLSRMIAEAS
jgi:outer membrane immunogenic protein